ncbi:putative ribonuclease h protein, partial [Quercus suber]
KRAYALALEEQQNSATGDCSNGLARKKIWKALWQLNIPQKIKHFTWRAGRDILATKMNLAKRKIAPSGMCELCGKEDETVSHLLWFCDHAKGVWTSSKLVFPFEISPSWSFLDVVENFMRWVDISSGLLEKVITVCWGIWKNRNVLRLGGKGQAGCTILRGAMHLVGEFHAANESKHENRAGEAPVVVWKPPSSGHYKVNTDGAVFSKRKQAGAGVIIRDGMGEVIAALSKKWNYPLGAVEAEAKALEAGINFARDVGVRDVEFETDSLEVYNAIQGLASPPISMANVLAGLLNQVSSFRQWKFSHTKRQGNVPAHVLAQHAKDVVGYIVWLEECPNILEHVCAHDKLVFSHSAC